MKDRSLLRISHFATRALGYARAVLIAASVATLQPALAHHSTANYDMTKEITIKGVVSKVVLVNPHSQIVLDVTDANGKTEKYEVFIASRSVMLRTGWRPDSVKVGDTVTVTGVLDRKNAYDVFLWDIDFADGKKWTFRTVVNAK